MQFSLLGFELWWCWAVVAKVQSAVSEIHGIQKHRDHPWKRGTEEEEDGYQRCGAACLIANGDAAAATDLQLKKKKKKKFKK